jgi:hypothetical protein
VSRPNPPFLETAAKLTRLMKNPRIANTCPSFLIFIGSCINCLSLFVSPQEPHSSTTVQLALSHAPFRAPILSCFFCFYHRTARKGVPLLQCTYDIDMYRFSSPAEQLAQSVERLPGAQIHLFISGVVEQLMCQARVKWSSGFCRVAPRPC